MRSNSKSSSSWLGGLWTGIGTGRGVALLSLLIAVPGMLVAIGQLTSEQNSSEPTPELSNPRQEAPKAQDFAVLDAIPVEPRQRTSEIPPHEVSGPDTSQEKKREYEQPERMERSSSRSIPDSPPPPATSAARQVRTSSSSEPLPIDRRERRDQTANAASGVSFSIASDSPSSRTDQIAADAVQAGLEQEAAHLRILRHAFDPEFSGSDRFVKAKGGDVQVLAESGFFTKASVLIVGTIASSCAANPVKTEMRSCDVTLNGIRAAESGSQSHQLRIRSSGAGFDDEQAIETASRKLIQANSKEWFDVDDAH